MKQDWMVDIMQTGVRKITNGRYRKIIGLFTGLKIGKIWWESPIERDYLYLLEADPDVLKCDGQPLKIKCIVDGEEYMYTPDFRVIRKNCRQIVEIKPENEAKKEENLKLFDQAEKVCRKNDYEFVVVTDKMIRIEPQLSNIKLLFKYSRVVINKAEHHICSQYFINKNSVTLGKAAIDLEKLGINKNQLFALLFKGYIGTNFMKQISDESTLYQKYMGEFPNA